ncbi:hypothetical protein KKC17_03125 [Patescibacteria group bacterium]|nr:hypothetical protein [Patescibacteria group bacterium]
MATLIGHLEIYDYLIKAINQAAGHAFCLVGPKHVGKTTLVELMINKIFCERLQQKWPDNSCFSCRQNINRQHSEVLWLTKSADKKNIGIDEIRALKNFAQLSSGSSIRRVAVIEGVEDLNDQSANALIKILEEPPKGFLFFLLADSTLDTPATILSRCQLVKVGLVKPALISQALQDRGYNTEQSEQLADFSKGRPGWALLYGQDEVAWQEVYQKADSLLTILNSSNIWQAAQDFYEQEFKKTATKGLDVTKAEELLSIWGEVVRDLLLFKLGLITYLRYQNLKNKLELIAGKYPLSKMLGWLYAILLAGRQLRQNVQVKLVLDALISRLI